MDEYLRGARRKARAAKDYFDDEEDVSNSSDGAHDKGNQKQNDGGDEDEVDPLDAFMMGIETQVVQEKQQQVQKSKPFEKVGALGWLHAYAHVNM